MMIIWLSDLFEIQNSEYSNEKLVLVERLNFFVSGKWTLIESASFFAWVVKMIWQINRLCKST